MVAALQPRPEFRPSPARRAPEADRRVTHLRVIEGGAGRRTVDPAVLAVLLAAVFVASVIGVRVVQGGPPALDPVAGDVAPSTAAAAPALDPALDPALIGDVFVADAGDTWWAIAQRIAPEADTTETVRILMEANGGMALDEGQRVIVPAVLGG